MPEIQQKQSPISKPAPRKVLGVFDGIALLIGITIGAGIYSTPQIIAGYLPSFSTIIALWILAGIFVYIGGLIYAELGSLFPDTGGEYVYLYNAFGPVVGFMFGWAQLLIIRTSPAAGLAIVTANYLEYFVDLSATAHTATALSVIALLGILNYTGIQFASLYQKFSTIFKAGGLVLLALVGIILSSGGESLIDMEAAPTQNLGVIGNLSAVMMMIVFSYLGWDRVGYVAGEMKNPKRVVPLSMFYGIAVIILLYGLTNILYHHVLGIEGVRASKIVASDTATLLIGPLGAAFVAILVIISASGSINGTMMAAPRVYYAMARDGLFFRWMDFIHPRFQTPSRAVLAHCFWAAVILLVRKNFETIVAGMTFAVLIFYTFTTLALFKFRRESMGDATVYRVPFYPLLPGIYLAGILALVCARAIFEWEKSLVDLAFIATGLPFAYWWQMRRSENNDGKTDS